MSGDLAAWLGGCYDDAETRARELLATAEHAIAMLEDPLLLGRVIPGWHSWPDVKVMCETRLRDVALKRAILAGHGRDEADPECCRTCHVREPGWAGKVPAAYPCTTARRLSAEFSDKPGYLDAWKVEAA